MQRLFLLSSLPFFFFEREFELTPWGPTSPLPLSIRITNERHTRDFLSNSFTLPWETMVSWTRMLLQANKVSWRAPSPWTEPPYWGPTQGMQLHCLTIQGNITTYSSGQEQTPGPRLNVPLPSGKDAELQGKKKW